MDELTKNACELALEFVEFCWRDVSLNDYAEEKRAEVEAALRAALAQPQGEPELETYKRLYEERGKALARPCIQCGYEPKTVRAAAPPQRTPLTNGEIYTAYITATNQTLRSQDERLAFEFARAVEAAHGITGAKP